jgi:fibronectin type III domain protein
MRHGGFIAVLAATLMVSMATPASAAWVTLEWDVNNDGLTTGYFIYYGTSSRLYTARVDTGAATSFPVIGLLDNTKYYFAVRAYDANGVLSDYSAEVSGTTTSGLLPPPPPLKPPPPGQRTQLLASVRADRYIDLAWTPPTGELPTSYRVEVGTLPGFTAFSAFTPNRGISFDMTDLIVPAYFVRVRPVAANGSFGVTSNEVALTPNLIVPGNEEPPPGNCSAPPGTPRRFISNAIGSAVTLTWQRGVGDAPSGYLLEVGTAPGLRNLMTVPLGPAPSLNANASNGVYALRLLATNGCGTSAWGAEATLTVTTGTLTPPGAPLGLTNQVSGRTVTLSWQAPTTGGVPTYYVLEATVGSVTYTFNTGSAATTATYTNVPPGQYVVRVRAGNSAGSGPATAAVTVTVF